MDLSEGCEAFRLLELRGEYSSFILDLETELEILKHLQICERCREQIRRSVEEKRKFNGWWGNLFSEDLPRILREDPESNIRTEECPRIENYHNLCEFIDERIRWRRIKLGELKNDAELELTDLEKRIS
jgi:hypothetical protein